MSCIGRRRATRTACRSCSCMAGRAPAARRPIGASSTPQPTASCCSTSAAPAVRRPARRRNPTRRSISSATSRRCAGICRWTGGWCSAAPGAARLALAYGEAHPERCLGFVLRGVFLGRRSEIDWFLHGMGAFFPEARRGVPRADPGRGAGRRPAGRLPPPADGPGPARPPAGPRAPGRAMRVPCSALRPGPADAAAIAGDRAALGLAPAGGRIIL